MTISLYSYQSNNETKLHNLPFQKHLTYVEMGERFNRENLKMYGFMKMQLALKDPCNLKYIPQKTGQASYLCRDE